MAFTQHFKKIKATFKQVKQLGNSSKNKIIYQKISTKICTAILRKQPFTLHQRGCGRGGGSIDVGLLGENDHEINLGMGEGRCCPFCVDHFLQCIVEQIKPQLAIVIDQSWCSYKSVFATFLYNYTIYGIKCHVHYLQRT